MDLPKCKYCGSDKGYFTTIKGFQDYLCNGEADGMEIKTFTESKYATCYGCGKKVLLSDSALEKQIPKKVNISLKGTTGWNTKCHCPNCHSMVSHGKYCSNCGQALDFNSNGSDIK